MEEVEGKEIKVSGSNRGKKVKENKKGYELNRDQAKFFADYSKDVEVLKIIQKKLVEVNQK